jgi:hypothetical protein
MLDKLNPAAGHSTNCVVTSTTAAAPPAAPFRVTGQNIAKSRRTTRQRVALAEALHTGRTELCRPTLKQCAAVVKLPLAEIYRDRQARKPKPTPPSLAEQLRNASPAERIEAARGLGVDKVWDEMILPLVSSAAE